MRNRRGRSKLLENSRLKPHPRSRHRTSVRHLPLAPLVLTNLPVVRLHVRAVQNGDRSLTAGASHGRRQCTAGRKQRELLHKALSAREGQLNEARGKLSAVAEIPSVDFKALEADLANRVEHCRGLLTRQVTQARQTHRDSRLITNLGSKESGNPIDALHRSASLLDHDLPRRHQGLRIQAGSVPGSNATISGLLACTSARWRGKTGQNHLHEARHVGKTLIKRASAIDVLLERLKEVSIDERCQGPGGDTCRRTFECARVVRLGHRFLALGESQADRPG
jgi:hypothetical protein